MLKLLASLRTLVSVHVIQNFMSNKRDSVSDYLDDHSYENNEDQISIGTFSENYQDTHFNPISGIQTAQIDLHHHTGCDNTIISLH
jgi:hypothetical protein